MDAAKLQILVELVGAEKAQQGMQSLNKGVGDSQAAMKGGKTAATELGGSIQSMASKFLSFGTAAAAVTFVISQLQEAEKAAAEAAQTDAKLEAVLRATGYAAGMSADSLSNLADSLSVTAGLDDELVKSGEAVLLTFTQIGKTTFPEAMRAAADMSAVFGSDLQSAVMQVGKAMNDFTGYSALARSGVSFTEQQKEQIANFQETNDIIGYQKLILAELNKEFGGSAKAINEAGDGSANLKIAFGGLQEAIGSGLVPAQKTFNDSLSDFIEGITEAVESSNSYSDALAELGVYQVRDGVLMQNGIRITKEFADQLLSNAQVADNATANYEAMAIAIGEAGAAATDTGGEIEDLTSKYKTMISITASFSSEEASYTEQQKRLAEERTELEEERATKLKQGYSEEGRVIKEIDGKLQDNADEAKKTADAHELATRRVILGYLQQKLAQDGLSEEETNFLIEKGVEWGIYSDTAVAEMKTAMDEADKLIKKLDDIPTDIKTNVTINTIQQGTAGVGPLELQLGTDLNGNGVIGSASGLNSFIVPPGYPNDNYPLRVQSGEEVTVTPASERNKRTAKSGSVNVYGNLVIQLENAPNTEQILASLGV